MHAALGIASGSMYAAVGRIKKMLENGAAPKTIKTEPSENAGVQNGPSSWHIECVMVGCSGPPGVIPETKTQ